MVDIAKSVCVVYICNIYVPTYVCMCREYAIRDLGWFKLRILKKMSTTNCSGVQWSTERVVGFDVYEHLRKKVGQGA